MTGQTADPEVCRCSHTAEAHEDPEDERGEVHLGRCKAGPCKCRDFFSNAPLPKLERCLEPVKRPPGRPRKPPIEVPAEKLPDLSTRAAKFIEDNDAFLKWLDQRRMAAIIFLGDTLADPKLFLEITDDYFKAAEDVGGKQPKKPRK